MNIAFFGNPDCAHDRKWIDRLAKDHQCIILCTEGNEVKNDPKDPNIKIFKVLSNTFPLFHFGELVRKKKAISKILKEHDIDICHSMYAYPYAYWPDLIGFDKHIITTRGSDILVDLEKTLQQGKNWKEKIIHFFLRNRLIKVLKKASIITSTSTRQRNVIKKYVSAVERLKVIRTGTKITKIDEFLSTEKRMEDRPFFFSARSMAPVYNLELILKAFQIYDQKHPGSILVQIDDFGDTPYALKIRALAKELGLADKVKFVNKLSLEEMVSYYKYATATVMAPHSDGTPNTALEAMYCSSPLIIGNIAYDNDIFNSETCYQMKEDTPENLAETMEFLQNDPYQEQILKKGKSVVKNKTNIEISIKSILLSYTQLLQNTN